MQLDFTKKLGVRSGHRVALINAPDAFARELAQAKPADTILADDSELEPLDMILLWVKEESDLGSRLSRLKLRLIPSGAIWAVIPKKKALQGRRGPTFAEVQAAALPLGLVDVKDLGFSETEYGIKLVVRRELRPRLSRGPAA